MDVFYGYVARPGLTLCSPSAGGTAGSEAAGGLTLAEPAATPRFPRPRSAPRSTSRALTEQVRKESAFLDDVFGEVGKVVVGQRDMVERVLIGLLTGGHCLIEGVPGPGEDADA